MRRRSSVLAGVLFASALGCSSNEEPRHAATPARVVPAPTPTPPPAAATGAAFTIDEWGLIAVLAGESTASGATGVLRHIRPPQQGIGLGLGLQGFGLGGKPVIYVHLAPGVDAASFSLDLELGAGASVVEHWPPATLEGNHLRFADVAVRRGACDARTPPPSGESPACATPDRFCEAAEIPRYEADHDVCLTVGTSTTDLLFYRAGALDASRLPLAMTRDDHGLALARGTGELEGPVLILERVNGTARIRRLEPSAANGALDALAGETLSVDATRALLIAQARERGLTEAEADAFVDAWAPAYFDHCHRPGPEAHGHAPTALAEVERSVLYFAPRAIVDAMLPLHSTPAARATNRVFLVRLVDGSSITHDPPPRTVGVQEFGGPPTHGLGEPGRPPIVRARNPEVQGNVPRDAIRRVVQRNVNQVRHCYEQGLQRNPTLAGRVTVAFVINSAGSVGSSTIAQSTLADSGVESCIASAFRRWQFPAPDPEGIAIVRYPLDFEVFE